MTATTLRPFRQPVNRNSPQLFRELMFYTIVVRRADSTFTNHVMKRFLVVICIIAGAATYANGQPAADNKDAVLPGRHLSEHQVADIAVRELPKTSGLQCNFQDGVWEISEAQKGVWGVASSTTNADGKITITSTNATRLVLRVKDADGTVEHVKTP